VIAFAAIAPHGDPAFVEGSPTHGAMCELGRRHAGGRAEATMVVTPHNVHVDGSFAVVTAASLQGRLEELDIELTRTDDRELAAAALSALRAAGLPAVGVSYGSNDPVLAELPMDWGTLIPLWFLGGAEPVVVVTPARDRPLEEHLRAGEALAAACEGRRVALVASADHGHRHDPDGPFGFHDASAEYDRRIVELVCANRLTEVPELEELVSDAYADSLWQLAMLAGAIGNRFDVELLSYEAPTYFGMLCAAFEPRAAVGER
jgi:aromatic ring-opening dioxygenase LigB subunit